MININDRCLAIIVVYDPTRAPFAISRLREFLSALFVSHSLRVVTNNPELIGDIYGSNRCGEFSGWEEGMSREDYESYDIVFFANDTFATRRPFRRSDEQTFVEKLLLARSHGSLFIVGELHWHINYSLFFGKQESILKWVRTNMFAMSMSATKKVGGIALPARETAAMVRERNTGELILSRDLPEVVRRRVYDWLNPVEPALGWHGSQTASPSEKKMKALCILQELDLMRRCVVAGVSIYSSGQVRKRDAILNLLYNVQRRLWQSRLQ